MLARLHELTGELNDLTRRTVVGIEDDELGISVEVMEYPYIASIGSLELVDGLIIIPDGEYVGAPTIDREDRVHESHLCLVGILELIDEDELVLFCEIGLYHGISLYQLDGSQYHIREVHESL
jgi:hypothetical protein